MSDARAGPANLARDRAKAISSPAPPAVAAKRGGRHFDALDGLRGVAALLVLAGHTSAAIGHINLIGMKLIAVWFFFMLSGFVVANAYEDRLNAGAGVRRFALARVIRLYPLLVLGVLMGGVWQTLGTGTLKLDWRSTISVITGMLGLPSAKVTGLWSRFPLNPPEWSLFFELMMYAAFAVGLRRLSTRALLALGFASYVVFLVVAQHWSSMAMPVKLLSFGVLASFIIGMLIHRGHKMGCFPQLDVPFWLLALPLVALAVIPIDYNRYVAPASILVVLPGVLVGGVSVGKGRGGAVQRWLGDISYPLYITHFNIVLAFARLCSAPSLLSGLAACAVAIGWAWVVFIAYDIPVRARLTKQLIRR